MITYPKLETNISPFKVIFEDDFPYPQVGYVIVPWRVFVPFLGVISAQFPISFGPFIGVGMLGMMSQEDFVRVRISGLHPQ